MKKLWDNITTSDVEKAIEIFDRTNENYPEPRNTFLVYGNKKYPAKHIRGRAYVVANKKEILKSEYSGGQETANFFKKLGFKVQYKKDTLKPVEQGKTTPKQTDKVEPQRAISRKLNVVSQKNAIQRLLQKHYGHIETEKKFDWLKTPNQENLPKEYSQIVKALSEYRKQTGFQKSNYQLLCDIVLDDRKLIIEYDENQHFSKARQITLENYPPTINLHFSKETWVNACKKINAKDNSPIDRDEKRAFYDTVRDIEAFRHGYKLVRIKHGEIDWTSKNALKYLKSKIARTSKIKIVSTREKPRILRLALRKKYDQFNKDKSATKAFVHLADQMKENEIFDYLVTPGGFFHFKWTANEHQKIILSLKSSADKTICKFWKSLPILTRKKLKSKIKFITFGIDSKKREEDKKIIESVEMVALFDTSKEKIIHWTGKSYPTIDQQRQLITFDLPSHFIKVNGDTLCILGCHDLNIFSPRAKALAGDERQKKIREFDKLMRTFKPNIILHHPHNTDTYKIWNTSWSTVEKQYPFVKEYASGIRYYNGGDPKRGTLNSVIEKTKLGQVRTIVY
jgi:very-short-patch-repair endonuclease